MGWTLAVVLAVDAVVLAGAWLLARRWLARRLAEPRQAAELGEEVARLVTELNQAAERSVVLLEDRAAALNELLAAADKKIGLLAREIERHESGARVYGRLAGPRARAAAAAAADDEAARQTAPVVEPAASVPAPSGETATGASAADSRTTMREEIGRLTRAGLAPPAIAARVGAPLGEVELIMSLERRARGS